MASLRLAAFHDSWGDGWLELALGESPAIRGFRLDNVRACQGSCSQVAVFGASGGAAQQAGWLIAAGHAFTHGVYGLCLGGPCVVRPGPHQTLLTTLSVAFPRLGPGARVCTDGGVLYGEQLGVSFNISASCTGLDPQPSPNPRKPARGVAFVKTYKTGSSTIGSVLHRYAEAHALDVAVNAKAVPHDAALERRLEKREKRARPTDCLYEFHSFKACGAARGPQAASGLGARRRRGRPRASVSRRLRRRAAPGWAGRPLRDGAGSRPPPLASSLRGAPLSPATSPCLPYKDPTVQ